MYWNYQQVMEFREPGLQISDTLSRSQKHIQNLLFFDKHYGTVMLCFK